MEDGAALSSQPASEYIWRKEKFDTRKKIRRRPMRF